jgi:saccharopine dehydrogenase (NAD+, L-lysine forming)
MFSDEEFAAAGATLVPEGSWPQAPKDHVIVGLKELPKDNCTIVQHFPRPPGQTHLTLLSHPVPLVHSHIQFSHCYKGQEGWATYLDRFVRGGGILYDIEFLTDASGKRVAAFGYYAGYAGAAVSLLAWAHQLKHPGTPCPSLSAYPSDKAIVNDVKNAVANAIPLNHGQCPRIIVIGALGRCGTGAVDLCRQAGIPESDIWRWDMAETSRGGPFPEIAAADVFVNCIYLTTPIPSFVTRESLSLPDRKLRVVCDVSCDPTDPNNPVPLYSAPTSFIKPTSLVHGVSGDGPELTVVAIDHLPSLVAREASDAFSNLLLPSLKTLDARAEEGVWQRAEKTFRANAATIPQSS